MKRLVICNTYYQLILALHMRISMFKHDQVDIWLSDHSDGSKNVSEILSTLKVFSNVKYLTTKSFTYKKTWLQNIKDIVKYNFGNGNEFSFELYDEIIFYNLEMTLYAVLDYYQKIGHSTKWSRYEEGILSYNTDFFCGNRIKFTRKIRKYLNRNDVVFEVERYYCMFPQLKHSYKNWEFIEIPGIESDIDKLKKILNTIFNYEPIQYKQKYIFFASSSDIDGHSYGETDLILRIAEEVGSPNLLVKVHPRDNRNIYEKKGICVLKNSYIPWEVMQINEIPDRHTLLTVNSGAFLSITAMLNQPIKGFYLYPIVNCNTKSFKERSREIKNMLNRLHTYNMCMNIKEYIR